MALWPVLTLFNAGAVGATFLGRVVRWDAQARDDRRVSWGEACRLQADALVAGALLAGALLAAGNPALALWMAPVAAALLASPALSVATSRSELGRRAARAGLFLTVDDTERARELTELAAGRAGAAEVSAVWEAAPRPAPRGEAPVWLATATDDVRAWPPR